MKSFFLFLGLLFFNMISAQNYDMYFENKALRINFYLLGDKQNPKVIIQQMKQDPYFSGVKNHLIFPEMGTFNYRLKDIKTGEIIFSKGFSPLYEEWLHSPEAQTKQRIFENVATLPFPKKEVIFEISKRNFNGEYTPIFSEKIHPNDYQIIKESPTKYKTTIIHSGGDFQNSVDLVIIAEGYTQEQMPKFVADAQKMTDYLFSVPPFNAHKNKFNIYAIESPSQESGTDIQGANIYRNTLLHSHFYTFNEPRYLTVPSLFQVSEIASQVPYDHLFVLVNSNNYGGGGFYNVLNIAVSDAPYNKEVFVHEFGHGFAGLADEYYDNSGGLDIQYNFEIEPWEPNITTLANFEKKWKHLVSKKTPIPTPRTPKFQEKVGVFEGGGYLEKGIFSPVQNCRMKNNTTPTFCPVCSEAIEKTIQLYTEN